MKLGKSFKDIIKIEFLDFTNSASWFFMDVMWLFEAHTAALVAAIAALISSLSCLSMSRSKLEFYVNLTNSSWLVVNSFWFFHEVYEIPYTLTLAKATFFIGAFSLIGMLKHDPKLTPNGKDGEKRAYPKVFAFLELIKRRS